MGDSTITIIAIFLAVILMFVFPLMAMSDRADDVSQLNIQTLTTDFVDTIRTTGVLTQANYSRFVQQLDATGNTHKVTFEAQISDENLGKKASVADVSKLGENAFYRLFTSQIMDLLDQYGIIRFKEGDNISVTVQNINATISQQIKGIFLRLVGNDVGRQKATASGMVTTNGSNATTNASITN